MTDKRVRIFVYTAPPLVLGGAGSYKFLTSHGKVVSPFKLLLGEKFDVKEFSWTKRVLYKLSQKKIYIIDAPFIVHYLFSNARNKDLIITLGYPAFLELVVLLFISKLRRIPILVRETHWYWPQTKLSKFLWYLYFRMLKHVDALLVPGKAAFKYWKRHFNNVFIVHYYALESLMPKCDNASIEMLKRKIGITADTKVILYLGRLIRKKGVDVLIKAYAKVVRESPHLTTTLVIAGDGPDRGKLEELSRELGIKDRTIFLGPVPEPLKPCIYRLADVFVYVPIIEVIPEEWPIAPLEALSLGISTIVSTAVGSLPEIASAVLVVKSGDVEELCNALRKVLENNELRVRLREKAINTFNKLTNINSIKIELLTAILDTIKMRKASL